MRVTLPLPAVAFGVVCTLMVGYLSGSSGQLDWTSGRRYPHTLAARGNLHTRFFRDAGRGLRESGSLTQRAEDDASLSDRRKGTGDVGNAKVQPWGAAVSALSMDTAKLAAPLPRFVREWDCCTRGVLTPRFGCHPCVDAVVFTPGRSGMWVGKRRTDAMAAARGPCYMERMKNKGLHIRTGDECYANKSGAAVFADPRGVVMALNLFRGGPGLGNVLFGTAGLIGWALRLGRLPAVGCESCFLHTVFSNLPCVDRNQIPTDQKVAAQWDGGYLPPMKEQAKIRGYPRDVAIDFSLYFQASLAFQDYAPAVCSLLQPSAEVQTRAQRYWDGILAGHPLRSEAAHRRTVTVHVRRGDYAKGDHPKRYGILSERYYERALQLIQARAALIEPTTANHLVAIVFTTQESVAWCVNILAPKLRKTVADVVCANTSTFTSNPSTGAVPDSTRTRCRGEEIDLLAMSLADYVVVANSTFSWWVHYFHRCRLMIADWWGRGVAPGRNVSQVSQRLRPTYVFPPVWMNAELQRLFGPQDQGSFQTAKLGGGRTMLFDFLTTDYIIPDLKLTDVFLAAVNGK